MSHPWWWKVWVLLALGVWQSMDAWAQAPASTPAAGLAPASSASAKDGGPVCVDAEIDGARALSYDCLARQLVPANLGAGTDAGNNVGTHANAASSVSEGLATQPSNRVGTFNQSAEQIRFGSNWGKSALPQRPPPLQATPLGH